MVRLGPYLQAVEELRGATGLQDPGLRVDKQRGLGQDV